jgi:pyruvate-formate lyase-activating enzyme
MAYGDMVHSLDVLKNGGVKGVIFTGGGEPLCNRHTLDGMWHARTLGLSVGLFTNGQLLDEVASARISREIKPAFVRVSLNAGNSTAYSLIHGVPASGVSFERVLDNLATLAEEKLKHRASFSLAIAVLITPLILDNLVDLAFEIKRLAFRYPGAVNHVSFRPAVSYAGGCWDNEAAKQCAEHLRHSPVPLARQLANDFDAFIRDGRQFPQALFDEALKIIDRQVIPILCAHRDSNDAVSVSVPARRFRAATEGRRYSRCLACPLVVFVGPDTSVYHCVERALDPDLSYGRLRDSDLDAIWDGSRRAAITARFAKTLGDGCPPVCLLHELNEVLNCAASAMETGGAAAARIRHEIDVAYHQFTQGVRPQLGDAVNFI